MTSEEIVKQRYPDAVCTMWADMWDDGYVVTNGACGEDLGVGDNRQEAWESASRILLK